MRESFEQEALLLKRYLDRVISLELPSIVA